jgi:TonB family protein
MKPILAILFSAASLAAQLTGGTATITGLVMDPSGARVPNATVVATNAESLSAEKTTANAVGSYTFSSLPAGHYRVEVLVPGFAVYHADNLTVINGGSVRADAKLDLGRITENIRITAQGTPHPQAVSQDNAPKPIRVGGNVMAASLIRQVKPAYPPDMKAQGIEGTVQLQAVISKEGIPQSLNVLNADVNRAFVDAALEAVKQWRYKPTLLNGEPVEVITTITLNFTLAQ